MTDEERIEEIMDWFPFGDVAKTVKALDRRWEDAGEEASTEPVLRNGARELLRELVSEPGAEYAEMGGFFARRVGSELQLSYVVSEWRSGQ